MPATTAKGFPYPLGTDRVMDGDNDIQALAQKVGDYHGARIWATRVNVVASSAASANTAVTFPAGHFTATPVCVASVSTVITAWYAICTSASVSGCTATIVQRDGAAASGTVAVDVIAVQF